jgi:hypothetical protein
VLSRELDRAGVYPPVNVLPSLSRLMKDGTGKGYTHEDHPALASQLYAAYARATQARLLASVVGEEGLSENDRGYLALRHGVRAAARQPAGARTLANRAWRSAGSCCARCRAASWRACPTRRSSAPGLPRVDDAVAA